MSPSYPAWYCQLMTLTGRLSRIVWAAIVLIAVQFAPVIAEAHSGHEHGLRGHSLQSQHATVAATHLKGSTAEPAQTDIQIQFSAGAEVPRTASDMQHTTRCAAGCCGAGMVCCSAVLASVPPNFPPVARSLRIGFVSSTLVLGIEPEGLRKPPRSFV